MRHRLLSGQTWRGLREEDGSEVQVWSAVADGLTVFLFF